MSQSMCPAKSRADSKGPALPQISNFPGIKYIEQVLLGRSDARLIKTCTLSLG